MGIFDRIFKKQEKYIETSEHHKAFSLNPGLDYCQLSNSKDNSEAIEFIKSQILKIKHIKSGQTIALNDLHEYLIVFMVTWDSYCTKSIGSLKRKIDNKELIKFGVILFEENEEYVKSRKLNSWYYDNIYVLTDESKQFINKIGQVPFLVGNDDSGKSFEFVTGILE